MSAGSIPSGAKIKDPGFPTAAENYLTNSKGILSWICTLDHKRIGVMYLIGVTTAFAVAGLLALGIRLHLLEPDGWLLNAGIFRWWFGADRQPNDIYNQVFTLHGAIMVFLFIIPSVPGGTWKLPGSDHVRCQRCRLPATESV